MIESGSQPGSGGCRTGSTRHDHGRAADLTLKVGGVTKSFNDSHAPAVVVKFVTAAAAAGAIGFGAGEGYMGKKKLHVGFGRNVEDKPRVVWGAKGQSANVPAWLKKAAQRGWGRGD